MDAKKWLVVVLVFVVVSLGVFMLTNPTITGNVIVTRLRTSDGEPAIVSFDLEHRYDTSKQCYANVTLFRDNIVYDSWIETLGEVKPRQKIREEIVIAFPKGSTNYEIKVDCK